MDNRSDSSNRPPSWLQLEAVRSMREAEELTSLDRDTLKRRYPERIVKLSRKRQGMKLRDILKITNGE